MSTENKKYHLYNALLNKWPYPKPESNCTCNFKDVAYTVGLILILVVEYPQLILKIH